MVDLSVETTNEVVFLYNFLFWIPEKNSSIGTSYFVGIDGRIAPYDYLLS